MNRYTITQELMDSIDNWVISKPAYLGDKHPIGIGSIEALPDDVSSWWWNPALSEQEMNNRLIALIQYANGKRVFEVEKPFWIVQTERVDQDGEYSYVELLGFNGESVEQYGSALSQRFTKDIAKAFKFPTKELAYRFVSPFLEVIERWGK